MESIKNSQIFGRLARILISPDNEVYIILTRENVSPSFLAFLRSLEARYRDKEVFITLSEMNERSKNQQANR